MLEIPVKPALLDWALTRSGARKELQEKFPKLSSWMSGDKRPSLKQLEDFSRAAHVPVGYLLLPEPPEEDLPVRDFRTMAGQGVRRPSPDLLDVIYVCQRRQAWYQDYAETIGEPTRDFVGAAKLGDSPLEVARKISSTIGFDVDARARLATWTEALRLFVEQTEKAGVLVMVSGVVGSNNHRKLDPAEFRGFALADRLAPVIFVNGSDTKSAQMFTLAHELAHIWLGESGVSDAGLAELPSQREEKWCNQVAAELLVPMSAFKDAIRTVRDIMAEVNNLARRFKVGTLVILRRLLDAGKIDPKRFAAVFEQELSRLKEQAARQSGGGDFYLTQPVRLSRRFAKAVISSTYEGQTLFTDAFSMLGIKKEQTLRDLGITLEVLT